MNTPENNALTLAMIGKDDAEHLIALDALSRQLELERNELLEVLERALNATVLNHRNERWHSDAEHTIKKIKLNNQSL